MEKSIIIIGAGMGGLATGVYGRLNGYRTTIFEQHSLPGGQCASWKRQGHMFDCCIHHLFGTDPNSKLYTLREELGAMPRTLGHKHRRSFRKRPLGQKSRAGVVLYRRQEVCNRLESNGR